MISALSVIFNLSQMLVTCGLFIKFCGINIIIAIECSGIKSFWFISTPVVLLNVLCMHAVSKN